MTVKSRGSQRDLWRPATPLVIALTLSFQLSGCSRGADDHVAPLRLATTTGTVESGLLDVLVLAFLDSSGIPVEVLSTGSGAAFQAAREGRADAVLVCDRSAEEQFLQEGHGINRRDVMYNSFVLVGPKDGQLEDSRGGTSVLEALARVAREEIPFLTRGDGSGTHVRETELWALLDIQPGGTWYSVSRAGMLQTLKQASKERRYILSDRSTFLFNQQPLDLAIVVEGDRRLFNPYAVIAVNPIRHPQARYRQSMAFIEFLTGAEGQRIIARYGTDRFRAPLFNPMAIPLDQHDGYAEE